MKSILESALIPGLWLLREGDDEVFDPKQTIMRCMEAGNIAPTTTNHT